MDEGITILKLLKTRRSIRQFKQTPLPRIEIQECVDSARLAPSARNMQPLEYLYIDEHEKVGKIFPLLKWAGYITPNGDPEEGRRPVSYLIALVNKEISDKTFEYDVGASLENFIIAAWSFGIGSCWLLSVNREKLRELLNISEKYIIDSVIALGYADEEPLLENFQGDIKYWKDGSGTLHVPKRNLDDIFKINII